ncbi:hypothetical protein IKF74_02105 [Candidatus Saccharibacteria bacterium]|nr:hypothetical protein [Candidatus Saccharibacteria bacterium]
MKQGVIFRIFHRYPSLFCSLALFGFFALAGLNQQLNLNLPSSARVRDEANFSTTFATAEKLDIREGSKEIASNFTSRVPITSYSYVASSAQPAAQPAGFHINNPTPVYSPAVDAGYGVMRYMSYGGNFLYGHSSLAFSPLKNLYVGSTFSVTMDGQTATYVVSRREVFQKSALDANAALRSAIYSAAYRGSNYGLALMTCGNGANDDSNHRLVLFANRI